MFYSTYVGKFGLNIGGLKENADERVIKLKNKLKVIKNAELF